MTNPFLPVLRKLLLLIIVAFFVNSANAQWQNSGPFVGIVTCFAINGSNIFEGNDGSAIDLSTNNGGSWMQMDNGLPYPLSVYSLAINSPDIFAGTEGGIFLSSDNGASWMAVDSGLPPNITVHSLAVSGLNIFAGTDSGMFLSTNNGRNWMAVGLANYLILSLAINDSNIFAGTFGEGLFLSTNSGSSWKQLYNGLTNDYISSLVISGSLIFVGTENAGGPEGNGVFLSADNGATWTEVNTGLTDTFVTSLAISGSNIFAGTREGGVFQSTNNGANWTAVNSGLTDLSIMTLDINSTSIFAGTEGSGVWQQSLSNIVHSCNADFTLYPDSVIPHLWYAVNEATGVPPLTYEWNWGDGNTSTGATPSHVYSSAGMYNICLSITDSTGCTSSYCDSANVYRTESGTMVTVDVILPGFPTGLNNLATQNDMNIYPNPANNNFVVQTNTNEEQLLQVFDITGKLMLIQTTYNTKTTIDAGNLASGIYSVRLLSSSGVENEKLVIVR